MATTNDQLFQLLRDVSKNVNEANNKLDAANQRVSELETSFHVERALAEQSRKDIVERLEKVESTLVADIKPETDSLKQMKKIGIGFLGVVGIGGATIGSALIYVGDQAWNAVAAAIRHWLRIG